MFKISITSQFEKDYKTILKRKYDIDLLEKVFEILISGKELPVKSKNHPLKGTYKNAFDCHIKPDWILIYKKNDDEKTIVLVRTGTHSDLF
jgi:mRNA interferase YafQ